MSPPIRSFNPLDPDLLRDPYHIVGGYLLDGIQGGTGAANSVSLDHTGHHMPHADVVLPNIGHIAEWLAR